MTETKHDVNTPSGRIRFALDALEWFEQEPGCAVRMEVFHGTLGKQCFACFGGAAALYHYEIPRDYWLSIEARGDLERLSENTTVKDFEDTLDCARIGLVTGMFRRMGFPVDDGRALSRDITDYNENPAQFKADLAQLADDLEAAGY